MLINKAKTRWWITIIGTVLIILSTNVVLAASASDDSNDNPDGINKWFAPESNTHNVYWYNYSGTGPDLVYDHNMVWRYPSSTWYEYQALAMQLYTGRIYEATNNFWTNLPNINHNEDSDELEEWNDGYEEKEVGTTLPETIVPNSTYWLTTEWIPESNGNTYFTSSAELNERWASPACFAQPDWCPVDSDILGKMNVTNIQ